MEPPVHDITSDDRTVWVNGAAGCIGRFGTNGIDIHRPITEQSAGECLFCTHEPTKPEDWDTFVVKMKELYGIDVPEEHRPRRFRAKRTRR